MNSGTQIQTRRDMNIQREGFSEQSLAQQDNIATVLAARAKAEVEARHILAMRFPRDWDDVRSKLRAAVERPGFAGLDNRAGDGTQAWYKKPIGKGVEGFSIRFAEEALRAMGNMDAKSSIIWEDELKRLIQVEVNDLENNISIPVVVVIGKTIERKFLRQGEQAISSRTNSYGEKVFLRPATEDEILQKQNSAVSKAMRNGILRLLPGDIQQVCKDRIMQLRFGDTAKDPKAFVRKILDGFEVHGVKPSDLKKHIGHDVSSCSKAELYDLRKIWQEIDNGSITWKDVISEEKAQATKIDELTRQLKKAANENSAGDDPAPEPTKAKEPTQEEQSVTYDSPRDELLALAKELWGNVHVTALERACENQDINVADMNDAEVSSMLVVLKDLIEKKSFESRK